MLKGASGIILCLWVTTIPANAADYLVANQNDYFAAEKKLQPGDTIILSNGVWQDFEITFSAKGTADKPISLKAETPGKVIISGQSNLRIGGDHLIVSGLVFRDGYSPTGEVISFRRNKNTLAFNSRITEVVIDHFNKPDRFDNDYWVGIYGQNNRFDHNNLVGKSNKGVTLAVRLNSADSRENNHRIDHNYFGPRPVLGSNGGETLRIGTSKFAEFNSNTTVENNFFDRTDGEVEIISSKSGGNIFRGNVFFESSGTLTLRHGDNNLVERNIFMGNGKDHTGGIRVINKGQIVRNNYMEGLTGSGFASALTVMNGVPNSPVNRYVQVSDAQIIGNSIYNSEVITLAGGADAERSAPPIDSVMRANLITSGDAGPVFRIQDDISGIAFSDNARIGAAHANHPDGISTIKAKLERAENGLLYPSSSKFAQYGVPRDLKPITKEEVGASWYDKPQAGDTFGTGKVHDVPTDEGALAKIFQAAENGDTLKLAAGSHIVSKTLLVNKAVTIIGADSVVTFDRPSLFEISEGGSLRLENLSIDGSLAPDNVGNAVIKTTSYPIQSNFMIELDGVNVSNLSVNKFFDVVKLGKSTFANRVIIKNSKFTDISGSILLAASETEDYGQYNAEYVDISGSLFENIGGPIVNLYRGGRDESTFGPHFDLKNSKLKNVGLSSNNESKSSILLHGAQYSEIQDNLIEQSAPIAINHTVGRPQTRIANNKFIATPTITIAELNYEGEQRVILNDNVYEEGEKK